MDTTTEHVSYAGASKTTGIKVNSLYSLVSRKQIPHYRLGRRHVVFNVAELRQWLSEHKVSISSAVSSQGVRS